MTPLQSLLQKSINHPSTYSWRMEWHVKHWRFSVHAKPFDRFRTGQSKPLIAKFSHIRMGGWQLALMDSWECSCPQIDSYRSVFPRHGIR